MYFGHHSCVTESAMTLAAGPHSSYGGYGERRAAPYEDVALA